MVNPGYTAQEMAQMEADYAETYFYPQYEGYYDEYSGYNPVNENSAVDQEATITEITDQGN
jgi:hypothetical protein